MTAPSVPAARTPYPARLEVDYPERLDRFTTFFRLIWIVPILVVLSLVSVADDGAALVGAFWAGCPLLSR